MAEVEHGASPAHEEEDGAAPSELIIEAARRNNTDLLQSTLEKCTTPEAAALLLNSAKTALGNYAYHEAAMRGHWEVIDMMLDQDGFECDPINKREGDSPLHCVVRWCNDQGEKAWEYACELVGMMCEAGGDPRIRNKAKLKPAQLVDPRNKALKDKLADCEFQHQNAGDLIDRDAIDRDAEEEDAAASNSDSDFDEDKEETKKK